MHIKRALLALIVSAVYTSSLEASVVSLGTALDSALLNNEQVTMAGDRAEAARARASQAFAGYLPSVSLSANYSRNYSSPIISEFKVGDIDTPVTFGFNEPYDSKSWQASLTQNLFTFGKLESRLSMAIESVRSAEEEYRSTRQSVIFDAVSSYFEVIRSEMALAYAKKALDTAKAHFTQVEILRGRGRASEAELLRARVALLSAEQVLIKAENSARVAVSTFKSIAGMPGGSALVLAEKDLSRYMMKETRRFEAVTSEAYERHPDLRRAKSAVRISESALTLAKSNWLPSVAAQGNYGWNNTNYSSSGTNFDQTNWSVAAGASWTLFDGFDTQSRIKEASVSLSEARASLSLAAKAASLELERAYLDHEAASKVRDLAAKTLESARAGHEASLIRFRHGLASNIELLDAQSSLSRAELDLVSADFDLCMSYLRLKKASGTLDRSVFSSAGEVNAE